MATPPRDHLPAAVRGWMAMRPDLAAEIQENFEAGLRRERLPPPEVVNLPGPVLCDPNIPELRQPQRGDDSSGSPPAIEGEGEWWGNR